MADSTILPSNGNGKTTFIYGLIDPRTQELRYVGKTVLTPDRRLCTHKWRAKAEPHKVHSMAWILSLAKTGMEPDVFTIEEVPPYENWVEREQFWIEYFRAIGANLCNHSRGGEGAPGFKQTPEMIARRIRRGPAHHSYGKPKPAHVKAALKAANDKRRADPVRYAEFRRLQRESITPEIIAASIKRLAAVHADPERHAEISAKRAVVARSQTHRLRVGEQSKAQWITNRDKIIAAQNAGKGEAWKAKQSSLGKKRMADKNHPLNQYNFKRRKLTDGDIQAIRGRLAQGECHGDIAQAYGIDRSIISRIKHRRKRFAIS